MDVLEHVADQEENRNRVHNRMDLFGFAADQFDDCIADATKGNAFGNAVGKRHHGNGEEARNGDLHVVPVDITGYVAAPGTNPRKGARNIAKTKQIAVVTLVKPVRPPSEIPELDST